MGLGKAGYAIGKSALDFFKNLSIKFSGKKFGALPDAGEIAPDALGNPIGALAELFSPSLKAAKEITQEKGSYEQLRAMMINSGAKADEMEWSGADEFFQGKKTTRQEIVDYLAANDPRLVPNVLRGEGGESIDVREAVDQAIDALRGPDGEFDGDFLDSERMILEDKLDYELEYFNPNKFDDDVLEKLAKDLKTSPDDLRSKEWAYRNEDGDVEFFQYSSEAVEHLYGGKDSLKQKLEDNIYERLEQEFYNDPPSFIDNYGLQNTDAGGTQYSDYFPKGGSDYTEKLFQYRDPTGRIPIDQVARSGHFGSSDSNYGTIFHTRQADFPVEGGGTARYIGEIQSDPQQSLGNNISNTYMHSYLNTLKEKLKSLSKKDTLIKADMFSNMDEFDRNRLGYEASIHEINQYLKTGIGDTLRTLWIKDMDRYKGIAEIPFSGEMTELQEDLVNNFVSMSPFRGKNWSGDSEAQSIVSEYLLSNPVDWLPNNFKNKFSDVTEDSMQISLEIGDIQNEIIKKRNTAFPPESDGVKGGPLMSSQNKWVDQALNQSILDAVNDPTVDYLTFPRDTGAIGKVGGQTNPKPGTINFYTRDVQNRLRKLLGKFDKDIQLKEVSLDGTLPFGSTGFKITPEFRDSVIKKGIPTFAIGTGVLSELGDEDGQISN